MNLHWKARLSSVAAREEPAESAPKSSPYLLPMGFGSRWEVRVWTMLLFLFGPLALWLRFTNLTDPLLEVNHWRQAQTALTIHYFYTEGVNLFKYPTAFGGELWNFTREFPTYQFLVAMGMKLGGGLEATARGLSAFFSLVSVAAIVCLAAQLFNRRVAAWAGLLFLISMFHVINSRVCMIDPFAQCLALVSLTCALGARAASNRRLVVLGGIFFITGTLTALVKFPFWMMTTGLLAVFLLHERQKNRRLSPQALWLGGAIVVQGVLFLGWQSHVWTTFRENIRTEEFQWLVGDWQARLNAANWAAVGRTLVRSLFQDYLAIPFVAAFLLAKRRNVVAVLSVLCALSILFWFPIHARVGHEYYFMIESPFLVLLCAVGVTELFGAGVVRKVGLVLAALLFSYSVVKAPLAVDRIRADHREDRELIPAYALTELTSPSETIYWSPVELAVPLYGKRYVAFDGTRLAGGISERVGSLIGAYHLAPAEFSRMGNASRVWVTEIKDGLVLYRTRGAGKFDFDPRLHVGSSNSGERAVVLRGEGPWEVNVCDQAGAKVFRLPESPAPISVKLADGQTLELPRRKFLSLPNAPAWGCRFSVQ